MSKKDHPVKFALFGAFGWIVIQAVSMPSIIGRQTDLVWPCVIGYSTLLAFALLLAMAGCPRMIMLLFSGVGSLIVIQNWAYAWGAITRKWLDHSDELCITAAWASLTVAVICVCLSLSRFFLDKVMRQPAAPRACDPVSH